MKHLLEFEIPEDQEELDLCVSSNKLSAAIWDILNHVRSKLKYEDLPDERRNTLESLQKEIHQILENNFVSHLF